MSFSENIEAQTNKQKTTKTKETLAKERKKFEG